MRITQGTFSYLPDLTDEEITAQVQYALDQGWPLSVEFTDDPHPRNTYWDMWGLPMFDAHDAAGIMQEIYECRKAYPDRYIRVNAYDASKGRQTTALSFIVSRPADGARFPAGPPGGLRPADPLHDARLRDRPAGRRPLLPVVTTPNGRIGAPGRRSACRAAPEPGRRPGAGDAPVRTRPLTGRDQG